MTRYEGLPCTHCGENFTKDSDVVVCPYCGAPYHRSCYKELGSCKFKDKHDEGYTWEVPLDKLPPERVTVCLKCKTPNPKTNLFCSNCHAKLSDDVKVISITKEEKHDENDLSPSGEVLTGSGYGISTEEISSYVSNNSAYFLKRFKPMAAGKTNLSWNWPAFFFKFFYFFYRKMYITGLILVGLYAMLAVPSVMYTVEFIKMNSLEIFGTQLSYNAGLLNSLAAFMPTINILSIVYSIGCGLFANKLYMNKVFKDIKLVREKVKGKLGQQEYLDTLNRIGKPDKLTVILLFLVYFMLYIRSASEIAATFMK